MALPHNPNFFTHPLPMSKILTRRPITASISYPQIDVDISDTELRDRGISINPIGNRCVVKLAHASGTSAKVLLPTGLITSFKPRMWHGGTMELLHSLVSPDSDPLIQGGLSLPLRIHSDQLSWSPNAWTLEQVSGSRRQSIQVELIGRNVDGDHEVKHMISLGRDFLTSEVIVRNSTDLPMSLSGSALCHLAVSTPDATYALGLERSNIFDCQPFMSDSSIIPADRLNFEWPVGEGGEEDDSYKHLTEKVSRVYTAAPRTLTIVDRGRRNSVEMRRSGFDEVYMFSPGSEHEWYSKYSFVCIGHAALLNPIILNAGSEWRGLVQLLNPNS